MNTDRNVRLALVGAIVLCVFAAALASAALSPHLTEVLAAALDLALGALALGCGCVLIALKWPTFFIVEVRDGRREALQGYKSRRRAFAAADRQNLEALGRGGQVRFEVFRAAPGARPGDVPAHGRRVH